jgi:serine-type D-Ala-D-Ala carboxypeptidase/endopeptidase (penicillin-binding protein 4)
MNGKISRRSLLVGGLTAVAGAAWADAPLTSLRPVVRPGAVPEVVPLSVVTPLRDLIAAAELSGEVGIVVADTVTGRVMEAYEGGKPLPPASVAKAITALYALEDPGPAYRFATRIIATGPVVEGKVQGDLILAGGGDPVLTTDHLAAMAQALGAQGVRGVTGAFQVWGGALPAIRAIDPTQLPQLGYNPAVGGLNLNFNRVYFEWVPDGGDYRVSMDARSDSLRPDVNTATIEVVARDLPVYTYADKDGVDAWTVSSVALGNEGGSRWLPVRYPARYAGDVFRTLAAAYGVDLPEAVEVTALPEGEVLVTHESDTLEVLLKDMLLYSTNVTAEAMGLTATAARGIRVETLADSAAIMSTWAKTHLDVDLMFIDHSGLEDASRISAREMVAALVAANGAGQLRPLLKETQLVDDEGEALVNPPALVVAKTGTLNFVTTLAGYARTAGGADLAFAIFAVSPEGRAQALASEEEIPDGAQAWNGRARHLQQELLRRWGTAYSA